MKIVLSSGHGLNVRGASGYIDEVDQARLVVEEVARLLRLFGVTATTFHDETSTSQDENLKTIVDFHNGQERDLDVSVHFNAFDGTAHGTEVLYLTSQEVATDVVNAIVKAGFTNRGPRKRTDLYFLNKTEKTKYGAILIETCFVDHKGDADLYQEKFYGVCLLIAMGLAGKDVISGVKRSPALAEFTGKASHFGGPEDTGVSPDEGLAFHHEITDDNKTLFLPEQPEGTTGLARRLDPDVHYFAARFDYSITPKEMLAGKQRALVDALKTGRKLLARPADWGPHEDTGRIADLSPGLLEALGIETDDEVHVIYPAPKKEKRHAARKPSAKKGHVRRSGGKKHARNTKKSRR